MGAPAPSLGPMALISGGVQILGGIFGMASARNAERAAAKRAADLKAELQNLENNRQEITNPYEGVVDLSSEMSNPFDGLAVATQAAAIQIEQADISLANTLDTVRATGAGAGGATALAQAALKSKKGVSADIEKQEVGNERMRAQGEQALQARRTAEKARVQNAQAMGQVSMFNTREDRENAKLDRVSGQLSGAQSQAAQARGDFTGALTGMVSGVASTAGGYMNAEASRNSYNSLGYGNRATGGTGSISGAMLDGNGNFVDNTANEASTVANPSGDVDDTMDLINGFGII